MEQELELSRDVKSGELSRATSKAKDPSELPDDYAETQTISNKSEALLGGKQGSEDSQLLDNQSSFKRETILDDEHEGVNQLDGQKSLGKNPSSEAASNPNMTRKVSEEQMLDIAEGILRELGNKHAEGGWTVKDVFDHPEITSVIPSYADQTDVKTISAANFLGRMYQLGIQDLTQLQVACIMRVLGKPDLDNSVLFNDLEVLLKHYGVEIMNDAGTAGTSNRELSPSQRGINEDSKDPLVASGRSLSLPKPGLDDEAQQRKVDEWCARGDAVKDGADLPVYHDNQPEKAMAIVELSPTQNREPSVMDRTDSKLVSEMAKLHEGDSELPQGSRKASG